MPDADARNKWRRSALVGLLSAAVCSTFVWFFLRPLSGAVFGPVDGWESLGGEDPQKKLDRDHQTKAIPVAAIVAALVAGLGGRVLLARRWLRGCWFLLGLLAGVLSVVASSPWWVYGMPVFIDGVLTRRPLSYILHEAAIIGPVVGVVLGLLLYIADPKADGPAETAPLTSGD